MVNIFIENVTAHRKTYFNAYPLNGQNRKSSVSCPLQIFFKTVNITVRFKRRSVSLNKRINTPCDVPRSKPSGGTFSLI